MCNLIIGVNDRGLHAQRRRNGLAVTVLLPLTAIVLLIAASLTAAIHSLFGAPEETNLVIASTHDLDGDGIHDLVFVPTTVPETPGEVVLLSSAANDLYVLVGDAPDDQFGHSVVTHTHLSPPSTTAVLVGAPSGGVDHRGRAYLFTDPLVASQLEAPDAWPRTASSAEFILQSPLVGDTGFGMRVGFLHDLTGDGFHEIRVKAVLVSDGQAVELTHVFSSNDGNLLFTTAKTDSFDPWADVPGDVTGDGSVTQADLDILLANLGMVGEHLTARDGDLNGDGVVDALDLAIVIDNLGQHLFGGMVFYEDADGRWHSTDETFPQYFALGDAPGGPPIDCCCPCGPGSGPLCANCGPGGPGPGDPGPGDPGEGDPCEDPEAPDYDPCGEECDNRECKEECEDENGDPFGPCHEECDDRECNAECEDDNGDPYGPCHEECDDRECNEECEDENGDPYGPCHDDCEDRFCNEACGNDAGGIAYGADHPKCKGGGGGGPGVGPAPGDPGDPGGPEIPSECDFDEIEGEIENVCVGEIWDFCAGNCPPNCTDECEPSSYNWTVTGPARVVSGGGSSACIELEATGPGQVFVSVSDDCCKWSQTVEVLDIEWEVATLMYRSFIHCDILQGLYPATSYPYYAGDNRWFTSNASVSSRTSQIADITVHPDSIDGSDGPSEQGFGATYAFAPHQVDECMNCASWCSYCEAPNEIPECIQVAENGYNGNVLNITFQRLSPSEVRVRVLVIAYNPCNLIGPAIDADFALRFRQLCGEPLEFLVEPNGVHDGFPWHELYINQNRIYAFDPCASGTGPESLIGNGDQMIDFGPAGQPLVNIWYPADNPW